MLIRGWGSGAGGRVGPAYGEASKGAMVRQKLESLCRELQRQNKMVMVREDRWRCEGCAEDTEM